jgi:hypothetical protein
LFHICFVLPRTASTKQDTTYYLLFRALGLASHQKSTSISNRLVFTYSRSPPSHDSASTVSTAFHCHSAGLAGIRYPLPCYNFPRLVLCSSATTKDSASRREFPGRAHQQSRCRWLTFRDNLPAKSQRSRSLFIAASTFVFSLCVTFAYPERSRLLTILLTGLPQCLSPHRAHGEPGNSQESNPAALKVALSSRTIIYCYCSVASPLAKIVGSGRICQAEFSSIS